MSIVDQLSDSSNFKELHGFSKTIDVQTGPVTGRTLLLNKISGLSVVDFDIKKNHESVTDWILKTFPVDDSICVKTPHNGIHIYCINDYDETCLYKNNYLKCYKCENFELDIFVGKFHDKQQCVNCPPTKVRFKGEGDDTRKIHYYEFIKNDFSFNPSLKLTDILKIFAKKGVIIDLAKKKENILPVKNENVKKDKNDTNDLDDVKDVNINVIDDIIEALTYCEIHNDANPIKTEITLLPLFCALNSLIKIPNVTEEIIDEWYDIIYNCSNLTTNAKLNYYSAKLRYADKTLYCSNYRVLLAMLYYHNKNDYDMITKKYNITNLNINFEKIDETTIKTVKFAEDDLSLSDLNNMVFDDSDIQKVIIVMRKVIAICPTKNLYFLRIKDEKNELETACVSKQDFYDSLKLTFIHFDDGRKITTFNILNDYLESFIYDNYVFYSKQPNVLTVFHGYKYDKLKDYDISKIKLFLSHIENVICSWQNNLIMHPLKDCEKFETKGRYYYKELDEEKYEIAEDVDEATHYALDKDNAFSEYFLNWFAYILQNVDKQTNVCLLLKSDQGTGKNTVTNVLCEVLSNYSLSNITRLDDIVSQYNMGLDGKKLVVCNELPSVTKNKSQFDALKSLWTESSHMIGEKYIARRKAFIPLNGIVLTNNIDSLVLERTDRRYCCLEVSNDMVSNKEYFKQLWDEINAEGFYEHLTSYFLKRNIEGFNPRNFPESRLKDSIKNISKGVIPEFVEDCKSEFIRGITMKSLYPRFLEWIQRTDYEKKSKSVLLESIKTYCYRTMNHEKQNIWKLRKEFIDQ